MPVSEATFLELIHEDPEGKWELHCGRLWSRANMTHAHRNIAWLLGFQLQTQLGLADYRVRVEAGHVRRSETSYYIPDVMVYPSAAAQRLFPTGDEEEVFADPLPLVVEVWSRSTGQLDVQDKVPEYQRRGDGEIWLLHPRRRTLTAWVRQPDGSYSESIYWAGVVHPAAWPHVGIDLDELFAL